MIESQAPRGLRWWFPAIPPERLAMLRILVGAYSVVYSAIRFPYWLSFAHHRPSQFAPVGVLSWLQAPLDPTLYQTAVALTLAGSVCFFVGFAYRAVAPAYAALLWLVLTYVNSWGGILHSDNLWLLHVTILSIAPAADALSIDARKTNGAPAPHFKYGWAVQLMCWVCLCAYFLAGLAKVKNAGWGFIEGDSLRNYVAIDSVRKLELGSLSSPFTPWLLQYSIGFQILASVSLFLELVAPLVILNRSVARVWAFGMWGFHIGVLAIMAILFPYPVSFIAFTPFFRTERLAPWVRRFAARFLRAPSPAPTAG